MANKLQILEDEIGRHLTESLASGELSQAASYGKPIDLGDGYRETPEELRMGFKILKDAGFVPPEVELMKEIALLRAELARAEHPFDSVKLRRQLLDLEVSLSVARDRLSGNRER
ncbi:MAG: DUF1992 domain-containing protein [Casimicrobium sp.]